MKSTTESTLNYRVHVDGYKIVIADLDRANSLDVVNILLKIGELVGHPNADGHEWDVDVIDDKVVVYFKSAEQASFVALKWGIAN